MAETKMPIAMPKKSRIAGRAGEEADPEHVVAEGRARDGDHNEKGGQAARDARHDEPAQVFPYAERRGEEIDEVLAPDVLQEGHHDPLLDPGHEFPEDDRPQDTVMKLKVAWPREPRYLLMKPHWMMSMSEPQKDADEPRGVALEEEKLPDEDGGVLDRLIAQSFSETGSRATAMKRSSRSFFPCAAGSVPGRRQG